MLEFFYGLHVLRLVLRNPFCVELGLMTGPEGLRAVSRPSSGGHGPLGRQSLGHPWALRVVMAGRWIETWMR